MSTPRKKSGLDQPYQFGDTIPAAEAVEKNSETMWALFQQLNEQGAKQFAETQRATQMPPLEGDPAAGRGYAPTTPAALTRQAPESPRAAGPGGPTIDDLLVEARRNNRVCPRPAAWQVLYDMLPDKRQTGRTWEPAPPVSGDAWHATSALPKRMFLRDHLEWAAARGAAKPVYDYIRSLPEGEWLHMGES